MATLDRPERARPPPQWLYDGQETLAAYIASASDLDDLIPTIVAYQIEWNKFHRLSCGPTRSCRSSISGRRRPNVDRTSCRHGELVEQIGERLLLPERLGAPARVWGSRALDATWRKMATDRKRYTLRMLGGSYLGYTRSTRQWWAPVASSS